MQRMVQTKEHFMLRDAAIDFAQKARDGTREVVIGGELGNGHTTVTILEPLFIGPLNRTQKIVNVVLVGGSVFYA